MKAPFALLVCGALAACTNLPVQAPQFAATQGDRPGHEPLDCARPAVGDVSLEGRESQQGVAPEQRPEAAGVQAGPGDGQAGAVEASGSTDVRGGQEAARMAMETGWCPGMDRPVARSRKFPPLNTDFYFKANPQQSVQVH